MNRRRVYCNSCESETWHEIVTLYENDRLDQLFGFEQRIEAETLRCCGCDLLAFRLVTHPFSFQDKDDKPEELLLPERAHTQRKRKYFGTMPAVVRNLYHETVAAHDRKLILLSSVGLRALLEAIVVDRLDKATYGHSLESKINALEKSFDPDVLQALHDFRIAGNQSAHAQVAPDYLDIHRALYVIESIMEYFYGVTDSARTYQSLKAKKTGDA